MPLDFQTVDVTFTKGLDTHTQRKLVVPGKWDTLINVTLSEDGSLKRRDGYEELSDATGNGLLLRNNDLGIINGGDLSSVSTGAIVKQVPGEIPFVDVGKFEVQHDDASRDQQDMAASTGGLACYVWRSRATGSATVTGLFVSVIETTSGARMMSNTTLIASATAVSPRVVFDDDAFFIFYIDGADLFCRVIAAGAPSTLGSQTVLVNSADMSSKNFDACAIESQTGCAVLYMLAAPNATSVAGITVTRTGTTPAVAAGPTAVVTAADVTEASICGVAVRSYVLTPTRIGWFVLHTAGGVLAAGLVGAVTNGSVVNAAGPTTISATVPPVNTACHVTATSAGSSRMQVFFDQQSSYASADIRPLQAVTVSDALVVTVNAAMLQSACFRVNAAEASGPQGPFIAGKAFTSGARSFLPVMMLENFNRSSLGPTTSCDTTSAQNSLWLLDATNIITNVSGTWHLVAGALYGTLGLLDATLGGNAPTVSTPCSTPQLSGASGVGGGTSFGICALERGRLLVTNDVNATPVGLSHVTMTPRVSSPAVRAQLAESAYTAGGLLGNYDGQQVVQHGFPMFPEGIRAVVTAPGGATKLTVGIHNIVAIYEWTDGAGNRCQSRPSLPVRVTVAAATDLITVTVPTTQLAQQAGYDTSIGTLNIVCYMTTAGGTVFHRAPSAVTSVSNDVTVATVAYPIGTYPMLDASLSGNELLYTQPEQAGSALPNIQPGPVHGIGVSQGRLWAFKSDQPGEFMYSQEPAQNTGLQFSPGTLTGRLPVEAGAGVKIQALDEKTILLCERSLYVVYGTGPNASGGFNNFSEPQRIPSDVGCSEALSVVEIPDGLMFKSPKGMYLLGRGLGVQYIGEGVAAYDANEITNAVMMGDRQEVRFGGASSAAPTLVYSYEVKGADGIGQWSVFYMGNALHPGSTIDAVWWPANERYMHMRGAASVFPGLMRDTPGAYIDGTGAGTPLQALIYARTGFLHVAALEAFQRVRRLYLTATAATALPTTDLVIAADFNDIYSGPLSYNFTVDLSTITSFDEQAVDLRHHMTVQKCKSVAFSFLEGGGVTYDAIPLIGLQAMALEIGRKRGVNKLRAEQSIG